MKWQIYPPVLASSGQEWQFHIATVRAHIGRSSGRSTPQYWHLVVKNRNFTFLLLELILADHLADLPPVETSSGQEWQFHISTVRAHTGRSSVLKYGNFTFLLSELILADQLADLPSPSRGI